MRRTAPSPPWKPLPKTSQPFPLLVGLHGYGMHAATLFPLLARMAPDGTVVVDEAAGPEVEAIVAASTTRLGAEAS